MAEMNMEFIKQECSGWKKWELMWLLVANGVIIALSIYWQESLIGILSATSGVMCVVLTGKGKRLAFVTGIVNTLLYAFISYQAGFYGETMLNALYYFPMQFYGLYVWNQHIDSETNEVSKKQMTPKGLGILAALIIVATMAYGYFLTAINGNLAYIDSFSTMVSIIAMIISIKRYAEQWILWIAVNTVTIFMWSYAFFVQGGESVATLLMWCVYLINAIIMYVKWKKEACGHAV